MRRSLFAILVLVLGLTLAGADAARAMRVFITVDKDSERMTVNVDGVDKYRWAVSTAAPAYLTPSGTFHPSRMMAEYFSKQWDNSPMPHSIFFTSIGHAIHGSYHVKSLGQRVSHGCVRLAPDNATLLYGLVQTAGMENTTIVVKGGFNDFGTRGSALNRGGK